MIAIEQRLWGNVLVLVGGRLNEFFVLEGQHAG